MNADWAFNRYEAVRHRMPSAVFPNQSTRAEHLIDLADAFDVFVLDAFGVLNIGETAIPGAAGHLQALASMGKTLLVLTNGATYDETIALEKYTRLGFEFQLEQIISSRSILLEALKGRQSSGPWGLAAAADSNVTLDGHRFLQLADDDDPYESSGGFLLLSSNEWTEAQQGRLVASLARRARPVLVGNPDIVAPREDGFSIEPGHFAHELADQTGIEPEFFGKPYTNAYSAVSDRLSTLGIDTDKSRIAVVGDTLHTDILGGAAAGLKTVLVTDHGLFAGQDVDRYIHKSGIRPDFIVPTT